MDSRRALSDATGAHRLHAEVLEDEQIGLAELLHVVRARTGHFRSGQLIG
jgi:hypothetical protein